MPFLILKLDSLKNDCQLICGILYHAIAPMSNEVKKNGVAFRWQREETEASYTGVEKPPELICNGVWQGFKIASNVPISFAHF